VEHSCGVTDASDEACGALEVACFGQKDFGRSRSRLRILNEKVDAAEYDTLYVEVLKCRE
jgi:hypothetical protein